MALSKPSSKEELAKFEIIELEELEGGKCSGSGSYGTVVKVKVGGVTRIAKRLHNVLIAPDIRPEEKDGIRERFYNECLLLSKLDHPCIVQFVGVHFHGPNRSDVILVMECLHTDLDRFLDPKKRPNIPLSIKLSILLDVSAGLLYLHHQLEEPLVHRDLKAENILITNDLRAKIADLGVSKLLKNYPHHAAIQTKCPGTLAYMPPEVLCEDPQYDTSLDIFSYGQLALYTAIQKFPQVFNMSLDPKMTSALRRRESEILKRKKWIDLLGEHHCLRGIILQCLKDDSTNRPKTSELKNTMNTLCVIHPKSLADVFSTMEEKADAVELKKSNAKLTSEKSHLEQVLASKVNDIRALKAELQSKEDLQSQVETLQLQVASHKADFEEERRDREAAHSKMADMEKTMARIEGRTNHEKSALILEIGNLKTDRDVLKEELRKKDQEPGELNRDRDVVREELRKKDQDLQIANEELKKHQRILTDLERVSQKLTQELQEVKIERQAKVSQVKQYAKENEKLKKQLEAAMGNINVIAEEMERDRKKAFELQDELEKFKKSVPTKQKKKWKKVYLPDRSEAIEPQMTKLEELYNDALIEIQSLSGENEELTDQVINLSQAYDDLKQLYGRSPATTPTVRGATSEQPLRAGPTDDIISDDLGTAGAGNWLQRRTIPLSQQLPLRARAPDGPPQGDPDKQSTQPQANPHGMRLPLRSKQEATGTGKKQSFSPLRQRPFSPKRTAKNPPTVKASGASAYGDVSPVRNSSPLPSLVGGPSSITNPPNTDARHILTSHQSAPLLPYNTPHNRDDGERFLSGGLPSPTYTSGDKGQEEKQELLLNRSANQFENPLQRKLDDEIHKHAVKVMREVSGKRLEESGDESGRPFDPNLICPMCMKKFRIGEIQYFKRHVNTCDGTDDGDWI